MKEKNNPLISVIIPVYNVEKFLEKTLKSVVNQTMKDFEVILINDGSTDSSIDIINEFIKIDDRIKVVSTENKGAGEARNLGIELSKGKYLSFVDSDDIIEPEFLESLYNAAVENDCDISCCNHYIYLKNDNKIKVNIFKPSKGVYSSGNMLNRVIRDFSMKAYLWNKLWKRSLFVDNNIKIPSMCFEDTATTFRLFYYAKKVVFIDKPLYYYTQREGSQINFIDEKKFNDYVRALAYIRNFLENKNDYKPYKISFSLYSYRVIFTNIKLLFEIHIKNKEIKGFFKDVFNSTRFILYCLSKKFKIEDTIEDFPDIISVKDNK